jgi:hypothetical protein
LCTSCSRLRIRSSSGGKEASTGRIGHLEGVEKAHLVPKEVPEPAEPPFAYRDPIPLLFEPVKRRDQLVVFPPTSAPGSREEGKEKKVVRTRRNIVPFLDRDLLHDLELVDGLQNGEALSDRVNPDVLESSMIEVNEDVARDAVLCLYESCELVGGLGREEQAVRTLELVVVVGEAQVAQQTMNAVRIERGEVVIEL